MSALEAIWLILGAGLIAYALTGGADFGGGLWDLLASGERKEQQRKLIEKSIAPIWEANHVWLIFMIVLLFSAFPRAFAALTIALHVPIVLALVGISFRGASFVFRSYGLESKRFKDRWGRVFGISSAATPVVLGMVLAAVASGEIRVDMTAGYTVVTSSWTAGWLSPFAVFVGLFSLALFALLAAVYLAANATGELRRDFRLRAYAMEGIAFVLAMAVLWRAAVDAPLLFERLAGSAWTWPIQIGTALAALATVALLYLDRLRLARATVALQVTLVVVGFGLAQGQTLIAPDIPLAAAGGQAVSLGPILWGLGVGALLLAPSLWLLFRIFRATGGEPGHER